ncbi:RDD family protein [Neobacillus mesonae]|uniref:RDD family protein n=1 Tax=Neobacillus mesonae TaxID=1193713 RepID=UPI00203CE39E|nr:RDD family protein [Neobacillus mesonae]MCM3569611.1 RDD family protein [Neobacillus mesonae]
MDTNESLNVLKEGSKEDSIHPKEESSSTSHSDQEIRVNNHLETIPSPVRYAGFWMRFWAYLLDLIVIGSLVRLFINPVFRLFDIPLTEFNMFAPISIASAVIFYLYFVLMTKFFNQTLGKMVFGLKVIDLKHEQLSWGTILFREWIGRFISATIVIGYIIVAFLPKKQGLHDLFTDTTVIHTN